MLRTRPVARDDPRRQNLITVRDVSRKGWPGWRVLYRGLARPAAWSRACSGARGRRGTRLRLSVISKARSAAVEPWMMPRTSSRALPLRQYRGFTPAQSWGLPRCLQASCGVSPVCRMYPGFVMFGYRLVHRAWNRTVTKGSRHRHHCARTIALNHSATSGASALAQSALPSLAARAARIAADLLRRPAGVAVVAGGAWCRRAGRGRVHVDLRVAGQQEQGAQAASVRRRLSALSSFYRPVGLVPRAVALAAGGPPAVR